MAEILGETAHLRWTEKGLSGLVVYTQATIFSNNGRSERNPRGRHATSALTTFPLTSVSLKRRPWYRYVNRS